MKHIILKTITACAGIALVASATSIAFAQTTAAGLGVGLSASATVMTGNGTTVGAGANASGKATIKASAVMKLISTAENRANQEITRRVNALNALTTRVNAMVKISASDKSSLTSTIQAQITAMNNLQAQIATDAAADSTSSLKTDIQSITKSYRIFALIIPQGAIEAAVDRVLDIAGMFSTLSATLQTRITAAQSAGDNVNASVSALAAMNAQIASSTAEANAAVAEIASLQPDNGVASVMASNTAALKDARSKIQIAQQGLTTARKDAGTIVKALLALKMPATASTSTAVSGSGSATTNP